MPRLLEAPLPSFLLGSLGVQLHFLAVSNLTLKILKVISTRATTSCVDSLYYAACKHEKKNVSIAVYCDIYGGYF